MVSAIPLRSDDSSLRGRRKDFFARNFDKMRRVSSKFRARACVFRPPHKRSPKLETTRSLQETENMGARYLEIEAGFEIQRYASNANFTINLLHSFCGVDFYNILDGPSNGLELLNVVD